VENIFKNKLAEYSEQPPAHVWDRIAEKRSAKHIWWNHLRLNLARYAALVVFSGAAVAFVLNNLPLEEKHSNLKNQQVENSPAVVQKEIAKEDKTAITKSAELPASNSEKMNGTEKSLFTEGNSTSNLPGNQKPVNSKRTDRTLPQNNDKVERQEPKVDPIQNTPEFVDQDVTEVPQAVKPIEKPEEIIIVETPKENIDPKEPIAQEPMVKDPKEENLELVPAKKGNDVNELSPLKSWGIEMIYGPYWGMTQLQGEDNTLLNMRKESESMVAGWTGAIRLSKQLNQHWEVQSGVALTTRMEQIHQQVVKSYQKMELKETFVTVYHPVLPPMMRKVTDTSYVEVTEKHLRNRQNQYTTVSIPLIFKYNYYFNRWSIFTSAGVLADLYAYRNAEILNESGDFVNGSQVFANKLNSRLFLSTGVKWKAGTHWSILAEPMMTIGLNNQAKSDYTLIQREKGYGVTAGIRYDF